MKTSTFARELDKLSNASLRNFAAPDLDWPAALERERWYFTPELVSLYGTAEWQSLSEPARRRLSFYEAVNFFSLNIHGEKYLISEIGRRLYQGEEPALSRYLLHFLEEEAKHMMYFSGFCLRYSGKVYPDRTLPLGGEQAAALQTLLLFARIYLFEEIVDEYNLRMAEDARLEPIAREINRIHHVEESRHLAFGRKFLKAHLTEHAKALDGPVRAAARAHLSGYLDLTWKQYYNPDVYRDAGCAEPLALRERALAQGRAHRAAIGAQRLGLLRELELLGPAA